jgi:hypothetical protein
MKPQSNRVARKTGTPTTNQISRAPNRKNRAAESTLTSRLFENMWLNFAFPLALPISRGSEAVENTSVSKIPEAIASSELRNPSPSSNTPPRKNPTPLSAFFDPVRTATHLKSDDSAPAGTSTLIALFALILVRSLAMPDSACALIT